MMLIGRHLLSGKSDWWIMIELKDGTLYDEAWCGKPFEGTQFQVDCYADKLAEEAMKQGLAVKEIHLIPIKRAL